MKRTKKKLELKSLTIKKLSAESLVNVRGGIIYADSGSGGSGGGGGGGGDSGISAAVGQGSAGASAWCIC
jgi:hypothetical protein